jgi:hypothetical protein
MTKPTPVFYDCEASDFEGFPIEIGWAFIDLETGVVVSESHLIQPPESWPVKESWDRAAERLHGITLAQLECEGRPVWEVATRMNAALRGRELYSDAPQDENWLRLLFEAAGLEPAFTIRKVDARILIAQSAVNRGLDEATYARAKAQAAELAPRRHRAEADARHLAVLCDSVVRGTLAP